MAREKILVVDDEPSIIKLIVKVLSKADYAVKAALSAEDALEIVRKERFDLLLTDIVMPGIDGLELLRRVRQTCPDIAVVIVTGHATLDLTIRSLREGVQGFIVKPFTAKELKTEIAEALKKRHLAKRNENENPRVRKG